MCNVDNYYYIKHTVISKTFYLIIENIYSSDKSSDDWNDWSDVFKFFFDLAPSQSIADANTRPNLSANSSLGDSLNFNDAPAVKRKARN